MTKKHEALAVKSLEGASERILISGDLHGSVQRGVQILGAAYREKCSYTLVLGDFGYWEHEGEGVKDLDSLDKMAKRNNTILAFLDGNHDNHPLLWAKYCQEDSPRDENGFFIIRPNVRYIPRGHSWIWGQRKFIALGGAHSMDKDWRIARETETTIDPYGRRIKPRGVGTLWWETETITDEQLTLALEAGSADVTLTHDAPEGVFIPERKEGSPEDYQNRLKVLELIKNAKPQLHFHGHFHIRKTSTLTIDDHEVEVTGLGDHRTPLEEQLLVLEC